MKRTLMIAGTAAVLCLAATSARATVLTNLARAGIATQSTTHSAQGVASKAIDGNTSGLWGDATMSHTADNDPAPWWQVDLQGVQPIGHLHFWFREECCFARNDYLRIVIYDSADVATRVALWETNNLAWWPGQTPRDIGFDIDPPIAGRVVYVEHLPEQTSDLYICLSEVEVFNQPLAAKVNFALQGIASSSSCYNYDCTLFGPQQAIDGNHFGISAVDPWGYSAPVDDLAADPLPYWQVELVASHTVGSVVLWPRRDRTYQRYENIRLSVLDPSAATIYQQVFTVQPSGPAFVVNFAPPLANANAVKIETTEQTPDKFLNLPEVEVFGPLTSAPGFTFVADLQPVTVEENRPATLGPVMASVDGGVRPEDISYRWYRNGVEIPDAAGSWLASYTLPDLARMANDGDRYKVQVSVSGHGAMSSEVALSVLADTVAPVLATNFWVMIDQPYLHLEFSELLDSASAADLGNFAFEGGPTVASATLEPDGKTVVLTAGHVLLGDEMALNISKVKDLKGNAIAPVRVTGAFPSVSINYARAGIATQSSTYSHSVNPVASKAIDGNTAGAWPAGSLSCTAGAGDYGWWEVDLTAAKTIGTVVVWWRTDCCFARNRNVDLVIYDSADPATRTEILRQPVSGATDPPNPVTLNLPDGTEGWVVRLEHTWETDTIDPTNMQLCLAEVQVLPPPVGLAVTRNPKSWSVHAGDRVFLRASADGTLPISYQWQLDGVDIAGATSPELVIENITPAQAGTYTIKVVNALRTRTSLPATVAVAPRPSLGASLVARYRFDSDQGTNIVDDAALNPAKSIVHNGENRNALWVDEVTDVNNVTRAGVIQFDGTFRDQQIAIPPHPDFDIPAGTICFWMKGLPANTVGNTGATIWDRRTAFSQGSLGDSLSVAAEFRDPNIYADHEPGCLFNQNSTTGVSVDGKTRVDDDVWHHVAYVFVMEPIGINAFYVDGKLDAEKTDGESGPWPVGQENEFGRSWDSWSMAYSGCLDDIHFFNRVLNAAELQQLMTTGIPPTLAYSVDASSLVLTWPASGWILQQNVDVANPQGWSDIPGATSGTHTVTMSAPGNVFYRLKKQ